MNATANSRNALAVLVLAGSLALGGGRSTQPGADNWDGNGEGISLAAQHDSAARTVPADSAVPPTMGDAPIELRVAETVPNGPALTRIPPTAADEPLKLRAARPAPNGVRPILIPPQGLKPPGTYTDEPQEHTCVSPNLPTKPHSPGAPQAPAVVDRSVSGVQRAQGEDFLTAGELFMDFEGMSQTEWNPPDPHVAVGHEHIVQVVNDDFAVFDKCGNLLAGPIDANDFLGRPGQFFDPRVIFDPWNSRWVMLFLFRDTALQLSEHVLVVSEDSTPFALGNAFVYAFDAVQSSVTGVASWADYYDLGYGEQALYVSGNQFTFAEDCTCEDQFGNPEPCPCFRGATLRTFDKSQLYAGVPVPAAPIDDQEVRRPDGTFIASPRAAHMQVVFDGFDEIFIAESGGDTLTLFKLTDPLNAHTFTTVNLGVSPYQPPPLAVQPSGHLLDTIDNRLMNAVVTVHEIEGTKRLYTGHTVAKNWGEGLYRAAARLYEIDPENNLVTFETDFGAPGLYYWVPSAAADYFNNCFWVFARCGPGSGGFAEVRYVDLQQGVFSRESRLIKEGETNYYGFRWGDYFQGQMDWGDQFHASPRQRIWMTGEYAKILHVAPHDVPVWGTWIGMSAGAVFLGGELAVEPEDDFVIYGPVGGPFTPSSNEYTVRNLRQVSFNWELSGVPSWLVANTEGGQVFGLDSPLDSQVVRLAVSPLAGNVLPRGIYGPDVLRFTDCYNNGNVVTRGATLTVGILNWTGAFDGFAWHVPDNWDGLRMPQAQDEVIIPDVAETVSVIYTAAAGSTSIHSLRSEEAFFKLIGGSLSIEATSEINNEFDVFGGMLNGSGDLTVTGRLVWTDGAMSGSGTTFANGTLGINGASTKVLSRTLENAGQADWTGGQIAMGSDGQFINMPAGVFEIRTDADIDKVFPAVPVFNNFGTVSKFAGDQDGLTDIDAFYENAGATVVNSGTLLFRLGGTHAGGFEVAEGATLWLASPEGFLHTFAPGSSVAGTGRILLGGIVEIADGVDYALSGRTELAQLTDVYLNATNASTHELLMATAHPRLRGTGTLTVTGPFNWEGGHIGFISSVPVEGPVTVIAADTLAMFGANTKNIDGHLEILGSATWTGRGSIVATERAIITIAPEASFSIETDANLDSRAVEIPVINNEGAVTKIIGVDDEIVDNRTDVYARYNNAGDTSVLSGTLVLQSGGSHTGPFHVAPDATLGLGRLGGGVLGDGHHFQSGSSLIADGNVVFGLTRIDPGVPYAVAGTTEVLQNGSVLFNDLDSTTFALVHSGGNLAGTGRLTVNGPAVWSGGWIGREPEGPITVVTNDSLSIETGPQKLVDGILEIRGDTTMNDDLWTTGRGVIKTTPTGTFAIQSDHDFHASDFPFVLRGLFDNAGTLTKVAGAADGITDMKMVFQNTGTVRLDSGALRFGDVFTQTSGATILNGGMLRVGFGLELLGGALTGSGTILGNVHNAAVVSPGPSIGRIDLVGDYIQMSNGALNVEIGGASTCSATDELTITGHAGLAGTLVINLIDGCEPVPGQSFTIMNYASHDGVFDRIDGRCAGAALMFSVNYTEVSVTLEVVEQPATNGDLDFDGHIDLRDMAHFQLCFTGTGNPVTPCCESADLNSDGWIDLMDFALFTSLMTGP